MLPLSRFPVLRGGTYEDAFASIQSRHPGAQSFFPVRSTADWKIDVNFLQLGQCQVIAAESSAFSLAVGDDALVRIYLPLRQSGELQTATQKYPLLPGAPMILAGGPFRCTFSEQFRSLIATFPRHAVSDAVRCFSGGADLADSFEAVFRHGADLEDVRRQLLWLARSVDEAAEPILNEPRFLRAQEELLLLHVAKVLAANGGQAERRPASSQHVKRATDFIRSHLFDEIGPTTVAATAGCSLRNLQLLFRREFGRTITEFIRDLRLQSARDRLLRGVSEDTVTLVALESGFSHLSDFARHYRETFGETPSQTVHRARKSAAEPPR